jgi:hypothetical protein
MGSFGNVCRLCCGEETNLVQIFSSYDLRMQLADKIKKYLDVEVSLKFCITFEKKIFSQHIIYTVKQGIKGQVR